MGLGMYGSNDGEDASKASQGWYFYGAPMAARRPTEGQLYDCARWFFENGNAYENLSASAFQDTDTPCLEDAIVLGQTERLAMRRASGL